jgi:Transposase, Mutator family
MVHKSRNVLDAMPKSVHRRTKAAIQEITEAEGKAHARRAVKAFSEEFGVKWPRAVERITSDEEALLRYYDYNGLQYSCSKRTGRPIPSLLSRAAFYLQNVAFSKWAMLGSNQRPPPCKLGQSFPGRYYPVGISRLSKQFWAFLTSSFSRPVQVCPAPVATRLQHATSEARSQHADI